MIAGFPKGYIRLKNSKLLGYILVFCLHHFVFGEDGSLGPPVVPFYPLLGEGSPAKLGYQKKVGTLNLSIGGPRSFCRSLKSFPFRGVFFAGFLRLQAGAVGAADRGKARLRL